ncbi:XRE family transcriptional regulator [Clostridium perfringens]|jgi:transcriptional regulator with XRE-family HTH domain|uniref:helix-turn-helix domain-containing protein n=1 Tax=Clostridium perfringens TaxID=1502 RepID=UPI000D934E8A|nr:helix-turn-helix transcriptional regulator [Clostridium perfringens]DAL50807.1 MAG TPA_asm: helix-turn-helix domain protein [Caudoviricetes sp.]MCR1963823.1 helix-turn-helix domain-containing protein [Clostridium perfringens]MCX0382327.1 helix-turn-helix domain-containing protein [Clostridium perfringens]MDM0699436.1 helix-turn-helix transcriptional regulator [Clostridium perfringens]QPR51248.1 helix-turn-helix transcriptional regulator [Clostridium perfringens]
MRKSERLKYLRIIYNLSQKDIAQELGITRNYLSQLENEKLVMSEEKFNEIVDCIYRIGEEKRKEDIKQIIDEN